MGHGHDHATGGEPPRARDRARARPRAYTVVEVVGGIAAGSLALLADAVHMLSDNVALALALVPRGSRASRRRPSAPSATSARRCSLRSRTASLLVALAIWIFVEAVQRLDDPPEILGGWMLAIALVGLVVNVAAAGRPLARA